MGLKPTLVVLLDEEPPHGVHMAATAPNKTSRRVAPILRLYRDTESFQFWGRCRI